MVLTHAQFLKLTLTRLSIVDSNFLPWTLLLETETCEAWGQTLATKTETKTSLVSAFVHNIRLSAPFIKGNHFSRSFICCQCTHTSLFSFFLLSTFLSVSALALALVSLIQSLHAQAVLPCSFLTVCPYSHLLYTVFLSLSCQGEIMRMWMVITWHYEWPRDNRSSKTVLMQNLINLRIPPTDKT